ncbi:MAG: MauE/DoxX family redox-associated membrane protein [Polyangiaceae bacterium]
MSTVARSLGFAAVTPWLGLLLRLYLGGVFLVASLHKIAHPATFALDVATYQFLPLAVVNLFALTVPWIELLIGVALILGFRARAAALVCALLMVAFMIALGSALARGLDLSCGCFASQATARHDPISYRTMLRDAAWLLIALYVAWFDVRPLGLDRWLEERSTP